MSGTITARRTSFILMSTTSTILRTFYSGFMPTTSTIRLTTMSSTGAVLLTFLTHYGSQSRGLFGLLVLSLLVFQGDLGVGIYEVRIILQFPQVTLVLKFSSILESAYPSSAFLALSDLQSPAGHPLVPRTQS